jgi:hypothetical protein
MEHGVHGERYLGRESGGGRMHIGALERLLNAALLLTGEAGRNRQAGSSRVIRRDGHIQDEALWSVVLLRVGDSEGEAVTGELGKPDAGSERWRAGRRTCRRCKP